MVETGLVSGPEKYLEVCSSSAAVFDLGARLPHQVYRNELGESLFCEFDAVLAPDFWPALRSMALWHGDSHVELLVLEPDCESFYLDEYQMYPAVSLPVGADMDDYWAAVGFEPGGDVMGSIALSANVIAVTGPSGKWGCWGERDPEVAVFQGFPNADVRKEWAGKFGPFLDVSGALKSYLPLTFMSRTVPREYAATLTANYGMGNSG